MRPHNGQYWYLIIDCFCTGGCILTPLFGKALEKVTYKHLTDKDFNHCENCGGPIHFALGEVVFVPYEP